MGEWSEYFEDFPEENPANWVNGKFNPSLREQLNKEARQQEAANSELNLLIAKAKRVREEKSRERKEKSLLVTEDCPQCGLKELNTYKLEENFYLCECQDCGIYGAGESHSEALASTSSAIGEDLDWREGSLDNYSPR